MALFWLSVLAGHGAGAMGHTGRFAMQRLILELIVGALALRWRSGITLRRFCPDDTNLHPRV